MDASAKVVDSLAVRYGTGAPSRHAADRLDNAAPAIVDLIRNGRLLLFSRKRGIERKSAGPPVQRRARKFFRHSAWTSRQRFGSRTRAPGVANLSACGRCSCARSSLTLSTDNLNRHGPRGTVWAAVHHPGGPSVGGGDSPSLQAFVRMRGRRAGGGRRQNVTEVAGSNCAGSSSSVCRTDRSRSNDLRSRRSSQYVLSHTAEIHPADVRDAQRRHSSEPYGALYVNDCAIAVWPDTCRRVARVTTTERRHARRAGRAPEAPSDPRL